MPRLTRLAPTRSIGLALVAAASVALLCGCTGEMPGPAASADPTAGAANPTATATGAPEPTETAEPPIPFEIACDALVTAEQLYAFNPNFGSDPGYAPAAEAVGFDTPTSSQIRLRVSGPCSRSTASPARSLTAPSQAGVPVAELAVTRVLRSGRQVLEHRGHELLRVTGLEQGR